MILFIKCQGNKSKHINKFINIYRMGWNYIRGQKYYEIQSDFL